MINVNFLAIAAIVVIAIFLVYTYRNQILELVWKIFVRKISDEKLERIVRQQYEAYDLNRKAYNEEGIDWLLDMAKHLCGLWTTKLSLAQNFCFEDFSDKIKQDFSSKQEELSRILSYWQEAEKNLTYELNRRKYFNL